MKRDLEEVTADIELHQKLLSKPEFKDLKGATDSKLAVLRCIKSVDDSILQNDNQNDGTQSEKDNIEKQYVAAVHKAFDEASKALKMDAENLKTLKSSLNTKASIRAFYDFLYRYRMVKKSRRSHGGEESVGIPRRSRF